MNIEPEKLVEIVKEAVASRMSMIEYYAKDASEVISQRVMSELCIEPTIRSMFGSGWYPVPEFSFYGSEATITIRPRSLRQVNSWLRFLRQKGFRRVGWSKPDMSSEKPKWVFEIKGVYPFLVNLIADLSGSDTCKLVQVGEKTVPVYRLKCDSGSDEEDAA